MATFLSIAIENGCIGSTFAEDDERIIVYTRWSDEVTLEQFRSSKEYPLKKETSFNHLLPQVSKSLAIYCLIQLQKFCSVTDRNQPNEWVARREAHCERCLLYTSPSPRD